MILTRARSRPYIGMAYIVTACVVMAYIVMVCIVMACIVMACIGMACVVTACKVMTYIVMACVVMACIFMASCAGSPNSSDLSSIETRMFRCTTARTFRTKNKKRGAQNSGARLIRWCHCERHVRLGRSTRTSALYRHCRRHVPCAGMGVPVLKITASQRWSF